MTPRPRYTHLLAVSLLGLALAACGAEGPRARLSYDRCAAGDLCGLATTCQEASLSTTDVAASLCTTRCTADEECPGFGALCIARGSVSQCYRACDPELDCLAGTSCHGLLRGAERVTVCVPDTGPRPCRDDATCAPFADRCVRPDAGASDASADASADAGADASAADATPGACRATAP